MKSVSSHYTVKRTNAGFNDVEDIVNKKKPDNYIYKAVWNRGSVRIVYFSLALFKTPE